MSKAKRLYEKLKADDKLEAFCKKAGTSPHNLRQIIYYKGSVSRRLALKLETACINMFNIKESEYFVSSAQFMFPDQ